MQNRTPIPREARPPLPEFTPVPRRYRHDGWTPERQRAFIEALADTGCVSRAAAMVNMAQSNCYYLRRQPGAEEFRRAWEAALDFGVQRLKDIAFERAIEGHLVPVFVAGRLMGFRRKHNDALLMFCLRHYGQDASGKRTTINYFSSRAQAGVVSGGHPSAVRVEPGRDTGQHGISTGISTTLDANGGLGMSVAEASTTTVRTVINGNGDAQGKAERDDGLADRLNSFEGIELDAQAQADMEAALLAYAERRRAADAVIDAGGEDAALQQAADPAEPFILRAKTGPDYLGELLPVVETDDFEPFDPDEPHWRMAGAEIDPELAAMMEKAEARDAAPAMAEVKKPKRKSNWDRKG